MEANEVRTRIKKIIANVANIPVEKIPDGASFRSELNLDSLSLLEIGVDVDYEFQLKLPEERFREIDSVDQMAEMVLAELSDRDEQGEQREAVG